MSGVLNFFKYKKKVQMKSFGDKKISSIYKILIGLKSEIERIDSSAKALQNHKNDFILFWNSEYLEFNNYVDKSYPLIYKLIGKDPSLNELILKQFRNISLPSNFNEKRVEIKLTLINNMILSLENYSKNKDVTR